MGRCGTTGPTDGTPEILAEQQDIADTFYALKLIPKKIDVRQASSPVALI